MSVLATGRAANPMHVVIDGAHIEDDDMGDAGNVNAASGQLKQVKKNSAEASPKESEIWESQKVPSLKVGSELYPPIGATVPHPSFLRASVATINRNSPLRNCSKVLKRDS